MDLDENYQVFPTEQLADGNALHDPLESVSMLVHRTSIIPPISQRIS